MKHDNWQTSLFWVTLLYFLLGFVHIGFAVVGLVCFGLPFYLYWRHGRKIWCQQICPRAGLFTRFFSRIGRRKPVPGWLKDGRGKRWMLRYFSINLFFATLSTVMVALDRIPPIAQVRFLMVLGLPAGLPQLLSWQLPDPLLHAGFRIYSMMFTSTVLGLVLAYLYMPRTWCAICPVGTLQKSRP